MKPVVLPAYLNALRSGCTDLIPYPNRRIEGRLQRLQQAREFIAAEGCGSIHMTDLCSAVGMSKRGLENLFGDLMGLGPHEYIHMQRLNQAHRTLMSTEPEAGLVKQAALDAGFRHLGRFAHDYHELFGELPSETLAH